MEETTGTTANAARVADIQAVLKLCFDKLPNYGFRELVSAYALEDAISESTAKRRISEAKKNGFIKVGSDGKYTLNPGQPVESGVKGHAFIFRREPMNPSTLSGSVNPI